MLFLGAYYILRTCIFHFLFIFCLVFYKKKKFYIDHMHKVAVLSAWCEIPASPTNRRSPSSHHLSTDGTVNRSEPRSIPPVRNDTGAWGREGTTSTCPKTHAPRPAQRPRGSRKSSERVNKSIAPLHGSPVSPAVRARSGPVAWSSRVPNQTTAGGKALRRQVWATLPRTRANKSNALFRERRVRTFVVCAWHEEVITIHK